MAARWWMWLLIALPSVWFILQWKALTWFSGEDPPRTLRPLLRRLERLHQRLRPRPEPEPIPTVLLALELRRLAADLQALENSDAPHRAARLAAAHAAYDQVLLQLCRDADVPVPKGLTPLHHRTRLDLESELVAAGVDW